MWFLIFYLGRGPASSLDSLAIDILEFLSTENEIKLLTLRGSIYLLPQDQSLEDFLHRHWRYEVLFLVKGLLGIVEHRE